MTNRSTLDSSLSGPPLAGATPDRRQRRSVETRERLFRAARHGDAAMEKVLASTARSFFGIAGGT